MRRSTTLVLVVLLVANLGFRGGAAHHNAQSCTAGDGTTRPHAHTSMNAQRHEACAEAHDGMPCDELAPDCGPICFEGPGDHHDHSAVYFCGALAVRPPSRAEPADDSLTWPADNPLAAHGPIDVPSDLISDCCGGESRSPFPVALRTIVLRL
jgi:hypothetical protein